MRILTVSQMIKAEQQSEKLGVSLSQLMDNAGEALAQEIAVHCKRLGCAAPLILVGKGNNGGDGLVAANILAHRGLTPVIMLCCGEPATDLSKARMAALDKRIQVISWSPDKENTVLSAALICDCIFGTGFKGELRDSIKPLFECIARSSAYVIACDIPSGANARSGQVCSLAVRADTTLTMHAVKLGMTLSPARYHCGEIKTADIGIPEGVYESCEEFDHEITLDDDRDLKSLLPARPPWGHKGTFGRLLCVCGSDSYIGAAAMACEAAMRCGVGLTELFSTEKCISSVSVRSPELIFTALPGSGTCDLLRKRIDLADAVLIGCGLGTDHIARRLLISAVCESEKPLVIDADGINLLSENIDILLKKKTQVILTPHPAELARLCGVSTAEVLCDRWRFAAELAEHYGVIVVSKAAETIITDGKRTEVIRTGSTALSKGGSGDMLAGAIASLTAQRRTALFENAVLGCFIIGESAKALETEMSPRGIIARDILSQLPLTLKDLETK